VDNLEDEMRKLILLVMEITDDDKMRKEFDERIKAFANKYNMSLIQTIKLKNRIIDNMMGE